MNPELAIDFFKTTVVFSLYIVAPFLAVTLVVGLIASLLQSITSIQEQTLTFVPKIFAMAIAVVLVMPWMFQRLMEYTRHLLGTLP